MATQSLTPTQQDAEKLAFAYRGFMRGLDNKNDFDLWYYGEKLIAAQEKWGFEMVPSQDVHSISRCAYAALGERAEHQKNPGAVGV